MPRFLEPTMFQSIPQTLLIDADDTLWHNNIYFERAIERFIDFLAHSSLSPLQVRATLAEVELANAAEGGYGARIFSRNLRETYERLSERQVAPNDVAQVIALGEAILQQEMEAIEGVEETLIQLQNRHRLIVFTKGDEEEQRLKIDRSGLAGLFDRAFVVKEKHAAAYLGVVRELGVDPSLTWMVGNSPKSDINPALAAGLHAVYIPYPDTWHVELQELSSGPGDLLVLDRFSDLAQYF